MATGCRLFLSACRYSDVIVERTVRTAVYLLLATVSRRPSRRAYPGQVRRCLLWSYSYSTIAKNHASQTSPAVRNNELRASGPDYDFRRGALHMFRQFMDTSTFVSFLFYQSQCVIHSSMFSTHVYDKAYLSPLPLFPLLLLALALIIP